MKRKKYWFLFAILLLSLSSLSPSFDFTHHTRREPPGDEPVPPQQRPELPESDQGPIKIGVQLNPDELGQLQILNERFMRETGADIEITPLEAGETETKSLLLHMSLGEGPDVILMDSHYIKALAMSGYLLPIDASQAAIPNGDMMNGLLAPLQWNGYQWGMPFDVDPYILTWQKKREEGSPIKMPDNPVLSFDPEDPYAFGAAVHLLEGDPTKPEEEALEKLTSYFHESTDNEQQSGDAKKKDPSASEIEPLPMVIESYSSFTKKDNEGVSAILGMGKTHLNTPVVRTRSFAVAANTESPALAMEWVTYMTSKTTEVEWSKAVGTLPVASEMYTMSTNLRDRGIWQKVAVPVQLLLSRNEAAALDFGDPNGFQVYTQASYQLLIGEITIEEYMNLYTSDKN
ncbi:ABC transporter substrate-binding protein [Bacillus sp. FJAT-18019]|nr:ABC transporter substrate-binding protein [Bacillus sp. FJAT-18019]